MNTELREVLTSWADEVRGAPEMSATVLRRVRRRRTASALLVGVLVGGMVTGAVVGGRALLALLESRGQRAVPAGQPSSADWRGRFPAETREGARRLQASSDAEDPAAQRWLDPMEVVEQYAFVELGWDRVFFADTDSPAAPEAGHASRVDAHIGDCNTVATERCTREADVAVERLLRHDEGGLWFVTDVRLDSGDPIRPGDVRGFVSLFLQARLNGQKAETHLSAEALKHYAGDPRLRLYGSDSAPFTGFEVLSVEGIDASSYEVDIRMDRLGPGAAARPPLFETVFVGPGETAERIPAALVVRGAMPSPASG